MLEELTRSLHGACASRNLRLGNQGVFYNPPDQPSLYQFDMAAFQRSAAAIERNQERTAALMRNARPRPVCRSRSRTDLERLDLILDIRGCEV